MQSASGRFSRSIIIQPTVRLVLWVVTHRIHGTGIFANIYPLKNQPNVGVSIYHTWILWVKSIIEISLLLQSMFHRFTTQEQPTIKIGMKIPYSTKPIDVRSPYTNLSLNIHQPTIHLLPITTVSSDLMAAQTQDLY